MADEEVSAQFDVFMAIAGWIEAINSGLMVDGAASAPLGDLQNQIITSGQSKLEAIYKGEIANQDSDDSTAIQRGNSHYQQVNAEVNSMQQQASNLTQKMTTDVNNDSAQAQEALSMASTINQALGFFNGLLSQSFAA